MVKSLKKVNNFQPNRIKPTSPINALTKRETPGKSKQQIDKEYYQKNKEKKRVERKERYQQQKKQTKSTTKQGLAKYYKAENIRVLMSLKEYTELNLEKRKKWANFMWTFKDLNEAGFYDIIQIMKIREEAENLINDYWKVAKDEVRKGKSWNILDYDQQQRLIKYWGREKARIENNYLTEAERLEKQSQAYLKEKVK